jgi:excisionase family DNA binding protein
MRAEFEYITPTELRELEARFNTRIAFLESRLRAWEQIAGNQSEWLNVTEAAEYLAVSRQTIHRWRDKGILTASLTDGGKARFKRTELDAALATYGKQDAADA